MKNKFIVLLCMILISITFVSAESCVGISFEECVTYEGCSWIDEGNCADLVDEPTCENYVECSWQQIEPIGICLIYQSEQECIQSPDCSWNVGDGNCDGFIWSYSCGGGTYDISACEGEYELQVEQEQPQGISKFWLFDKLSPTGEVTSENGQTRIGLFSSIGNFFQNILNWFKGLFN